MSRTSIFQAIRGRDEFAAELAPSVATVQYRPTYENKLRLIGRHLDLHRLRSVKVLEVPGGMLARVILPDAMADELLEFPDAGFESLMEQVQQVRNPEDDRDDLRIKSEIIPTSYEDVLRALGAEFDAWATRSVLISEGRGCLFVSGIRLENNSMRSVYVPFDELFGPDEIDTILSKAYARRIAS